MAYDTKVILTMMAQAIAQSKNLEEAYMFIARAANVEGVQLPTYYDMLKEINKSKQGDK